MNARKNGTRKTKERIAFLPGDLAVLRSGNGTGGCTGYERLAVVDGLVLGKGSDRLTVGNARPVSCRPGSLVLILYVTRCVGMPDSEAPWTFAIIGDTVLWMPGFNMRPIKTAEA
jgi:hypothetical protein